MFREFGVRKLDDLLAEIGIGNLMAYAVAQRLMAADNPDYEAVDIERGGPVAIRGGEGLVITYARCCGPVPGDHVVGHMTPGKGLVVHIETCNNVAELRRRNPREIIPSRWSTPTQGEFETTLDVGVNRRKGVVAELANAVNGADAGINNITVDERTADLSSIRLEVSVRDKDHLERVRQRLSGRGGRPIRTAARGRRTGRRGRLSPDVPRKAVQTDAAPQAIGTYSQALAVDHTVYLSGQIPLDPDTMQIVAGGIRREVEQVLANLAAVAAAAGAGLEDIVKLTVYLTDLNDFETVNQVMAREFRRALSRACRRPSRGPAARRPSGDRRGACT